MKKIIAVNASPRGNWNTATLVKEAAKGAESKGVEIKYYDLYKLEKFTGCLSCFGCKLPANLGRCICKDGLSEVLEEIRTADGLIIGSPNYLGDVTAGFRSLFERLIFQYITYKVEPVSYSERKIPVLLVMTSNADQSFYDKLGYTATLEKYKGSFDNFIGPTKIMVCGNTWQVNDYARYNWTRFDVDTKKQRRETVFPSEKKNAYNLGVQMAEGQWE